MEDLNIRSKATVDYIQGMQAFRQKDAPKLGAILKKMATRRTKAETLVTDSGTPMCSAAGANRFAPNRSDIDQSHIMEMELRALRHWNEPALAEDWLKKATKMEEDATYAYGPPRVVQPTHELYGRWLLEQGRGADAKALFAQALERGPKRWQAMKGMWLAHQQLGEQTAAENMKVALESLFKDAEVPVETLLNGQTLLSLNTER